MVIKIEGISKTYAADRSSPPLDVLLDVSLNIAEGELLAIVGPSGCGKTTLLKIVAGLLSDHSGRVLGPEGNLAPHDVGYVFQHPNLLPWRSVKQNVSLGIEVRSYRRHHSSAELELASKRVDELIDLVGLRGFEPYFPGQLSGGMQQRVNLARALAIDPKILLLDEPFSALDAQTRERMQVELQGILIETEKTAIMVTHDIREAAYLSDRVAVLSARPGRVLDVLKVPEQRPRDFKYQLTDEFASICAQLYQAIPSLPQAADAVPDNAL